MYSGRNRGHSSRDTALCVLGMLLAGEINKVHHGDGLHGARATQHGLARKCVTESANHLFGDLSEGPRFVFGALPSPAQPLAVRPTL